MEITLKQMVMIMSRNDRFPLSCEGGNGHGKGNIVYRNEHDDWIFISSSTSFEPSDEFIWKTLQKHIRHIKKAWNLYNH